jgi:uncharacterized protein (DUF1810 family)
MTAVTSMPGTGNAQVEERSPVTGRDVSRPHAIGQEGMAAQVEQADAAPESKSGISLERLDAELLLADRAYDALKRAIRELRCGHKTSHWMWFVFPQIAGLGHSSTSRQFAISSLEEATAYLRHIVLGPRLLECAQIVAETKGLSAEQIFGPVDAPKLRSSMTLFLRASRGFARSSTSTSTGLPTRQPTSASEVVDARPGAQQAMGANRGRALSRAGVFSRRAGGPTASSLSTGWGKGAGGSVSSRLLKPPLAVFAAALAGGGPAT